MRTARRALGFVGVLTGFLAACQPAAPGQKEAEEAIVAQERRALGEWAKGNPLGYLDVDADDVTYFDDIGAHTRVDGIAAMRTYLTSLQGKIPPHRYEMLDPKVQLYGDIGILTLRYEAYGAAVEPLSRWKATSVYHRAGGQWRIVHAHWSLVKEGESRRSSGP